MRKKKNSPAIIIIYIFSTDQSGKKINCGHYNTICYNEQSETWILYDDANTKVVDGTSVIHQDAYVLMYKLKEKEPLIIQHEDLDDNSVLCDYTELMSNPSQSEMENTFESETYITLSEIKDNDDTDGLEEYEISSTEAEILSAPSLTVSEEHWADQYFFRV